MSALNWIAGALGEEIDSADLSRPYSRP